MKKYEGYAQRLIPILVEHELIHEDVDVFDDYLLFQEAENA